MTDLISKFFGKKDAQAVDSLFNTNFVTAKNAYMMAKHGKICTQVDLLKTFLTELKSLIETKSGQFEFMCVKHVEDDIVELLPVIIDYLTNKLGYKCIILDPETTIYNHVNAKDVKSDVKFTSTTLLLFWDVADISEHLYENINIQAIEAPEKTSEQSDADEE